MRDEIRKIAQVIENGQDPTARQRMQLERYLTNLQDVRKCTIECIEYSKSVNNTSVVQEQEQEIQRIDNEIQRINNLLNDNYKSDSKRAKEFINNLFEMLSHNIEVASFKYGIENAIDYYDLNATRIEILDPKTLKEYNLTQLDASTIYDSVLNKIRKRYAKEIALEKQRVKYLTKRRDITRAMVIGGVVGLNLLQKKINKGAGIK